MESTEKTAVNGVWRKGPGKDLFDVLDQVSTHSTPQTQLQSLLSTASRGISKIISVRGPPLGEQSRGWTT